jgi:thiol:disulfide interchange protein DsbC
MLKKQSYGLVGLLMLALSGAVLAEEKASVQVGGILKTQNTVEQTIINSLQQARPDMKVTSVVPSPISGLYLAQIGGGSVLVTADGKKLILGEIYNVQANGFSKWENPAVVAERKKLLASINEKDSIVFKAEGGPKAVVYVFTDVDCGYCRKLNSEMAAYNKLGIEIRYLAFPRAGIPSGSADKLITAWCSSDRQKALTMLKEDQIVPMLTCDNPVAAQFALGGRLGVNGTPAIWMPNGELKPGYLPPEVLARELGIL